MLKNTVMRFELNELMTLLINDVKRFPPLNKIDQTDSITIGDTSIAKFLEIGTQNVSTLKNNIVLIILIDSMVYLILDEMRNSIEQHYKADNSKVEDVVLGVNEKSVKLLKKVQASQLCI